MEPLRDLSIIRKWDKFKPSMEGYVPPGQMDIGKINIHEEFKKWLDPSYLRVNKAVFATSHTYDEGAYPNPCLKVENLGSIGIPVSYRDADAIGLSVSAEQVSFTNPKWTPWVQQVACQLCDQLGTSNPTADQEVRFRGDPFRLSAQWCEVRDLSQSSGAGHFATLVIIFPSEFNGADLTVRHGAEETIFHPDKKPELSIFAAAFYTGLSKVTFGPVRHGSMLYLTYHLISMNRDKPPTFERSKISAVPGLRDTFCAWRQALDSKSPLTGVPNLLLFLSEKVSSRFDATSVTSLDGEDKERLLHVAPVAKAYGFQVLLGTLKYTISRHDMEIATGYVPREGWVDEDPVDPEEVEMDLKDADRDFKWTLYRTDGTPLPVAPYLEEDLEEAYDNEFSYGDVIDEDDSEKFEKEFCELDRIQYHRLGYLTWTLKKGIMVVIPNELL